MSPWPSPYPLLERDGLYPYTNPLRRKGILVARNMELIGYLDRCDGHSGYTFAGAYGSHPFGGFGFD